MNMFWHGEPREMFYMLYLDKNGTITVICVQDFDLVDYDSRKYVRNSKKECHAFDTEEKAIEFLNEKYTEIEVDPEYWRGGENFLIRD